MPAPSTQEMLDAVRTAIHAIVVGGLESATINGRTWKKNDLAKLRQMEKDYAGMVARGSARTLATGRFDAPR